MEESEEGCQFISGVFRLVCGNYVTILALVPLLVFLGKELTMGRCYSKKRLDGKVAIVTGANAGIGFETALDLVRRGCMVILACRNKQKGDAAVDKIKLITGSQNVKLIELDLASLKSVRKFVEDFKSTHQSLDLLVNNAGIGAGYLIGQGGKGSQRKLTRDKLEVTMQSNHFSHFLLTNLLYESLKKSQDPRVINVCSDSHMYIDVDLDNLNCEKEFIPDNIYGTTKLANLIFTKEIARRWGADGIQSYAPHPGMVRTSFFDNATTFMKTFLAVLWWWLGKNAEQGAQTTIYCCVEDNLTNGGYFMDCMELTRMYHRAADDKDLGAKFWNKSASLVRL